MGVAGAQWGSAEVIGARLGLIALYQCGSVRNVYTQGCIYIAH